MCFSRVYIQGVPKIFRDFSQKFSSFVSVAEQVQAIYVVEYIRDIKVIYITRKNLINFQHTFLEILFLFVFHTRIVAIATAVTRSSVSFLNNFVNKPVTKIFAKENCCLKSPKFSGHPVCACIQRRGGRKIHESVCNRSRYSTLVTTPFKLGIGVREFPSGFEELIPKLSLSLRIFDNDRI